MSMRLLESAADIDSVEELPEEVIEEIEEEVYGQRDYFQELARDER